MHDNQENMYDIMQRLGLDSIETQIQVRRLRWLGRIASFPPGRWEHIAFQKETGMGPGVIWLKTPPSGKKLTKEMALETTPRGEKQGMEQTNRDYTWR